MLRDGLRAADPDLAAFIEPVKTDDYDQVEDLLGDGYEIVYQARRDPQAWARRSRVAGRSGACTNSTCA